MKTYNFNDKKLVEQGIQWNLLPTSPSTPFARNKNFGSYSIQRGRTFFGVGNPKSKASGIYWWMIFLGKVTRNMEMDILPYRRQDVSREPPTVLSESLSFCTSYYDDSEEEGKLIRIII